MQFTDLGKISYDDALSRMMQAHADCVAGTGSDEIFLLEHEPVITKGRRLHGQSIPFEEQILKNGIQIRDADRGGLLTYHGPGQLVVYFVIRLTNHFNGISRMVHALEEVIQEFLQGFDLSGRTDPIHPGIWVRDKKIASIGLRVADGVTRHGISINIRNDLTAYRYFDPCGLTGSTMSALDKVMECAISDDDFKNCKTRIVDVLRAKLHVHDDKITLRQ